MKDLPKVEVVQIKNIPEPGLQEGQEPIQPVQGKIPVVLQGGMEIDGMHAQDRRPTLPEGFFGFLKDLPFHGPLCIQGRFEGYVPVQAEKPMGIEVWGSGETGSFLDHPNSGLGPAPQGILVGPIPRSAGRKAYGGCSNPKR